MKTINKTEGEIEKFCNLEVNSTECEKKEYYIYTEIYAAEGTNRTWLFLEDNFTLIINNTVYWGDFKNICKWTASSS